MAPPDTDELASALRTLAERRCRFDAYDERRMLAPHVVMELGALGVLGLTAPRELGGLGLSFTQMTVVEQQLAGIDLSLASFVGIHNALGLHPILTHGSDAMKARMRPFAEGRAILAFALSEPGAGADPGAIRTQATPSGAGAFRLDGEKIWIGNAGWARAILVVCREAAEGGDQGYSAFFVPTDRAGVVIGPECATLGLRSIVQNEVRFEGAAVTEADRVGEAGRGFDVATAAMQLGRLGICAMATGATKRGVQLAARFAGRRIVAGRPLAERLHVRAALADAAADAAFLDAGLRYCAGEMDAGRAVPEFFSLALKIASSEWSWTGLDRMLQVTGGRGYDEANALSRLLRDVRILRIFEGPSEALATYLGMTALFQPRSVASACGEWPDGRAAADEVAAWRREVTGRAAELPSDLRRAALEAICLPLGHLTAFRFCRLAAERAGATPPAGWLDAKLAEARAGLDAALARPWREAADWDMAGAQAALAEEIGDLPLPDAPGFVPPDDYFRPKEGEER